MVGDDCVIVGVVMLLIVRPVVVFFRNDLCFIELFFRV